jgi:TMEM175 potassium channel family protein
LQAVRHVNGRILWANLHLLFWLSLVPFATAWMGESHFAPMAVAGYGVPLLLAGVAYYVLERALIAHHPHDPTLAAAVGADLKGIVSVVVYAIAIPLAFARPWLSCALYAGVAIWWLVPDRRIERAMDARS